MNPNPYYKNWCLTVSQPDKWGQVTVSAAADGLCLQVTRNTKRLALAEIKRQIDIIEGCGVAKMAENGAARRAG